MFLLFLLKLLESLQYSLVEWLALGRVWISAVCHVTSNFRLEQFRTNMPLIESPIGAPHPGKVSFVGHKFTQSPRTIALFLYCSKNGATMTGLSFNNFKSFPNYAENFGFATLFFNFKINKIQQTNFPNFGFAMSHYQRLNFFWIWNNFLIIMAIDCCVFKNLVAFRNFQSAIILQ